MKYNTVFSNRRSISLSIKNGELTVRAPLGTNEKRIAELVEKHEKWIEKHLLKSIEREEKFESLSKEAVNELKRNAKEYFFAKTEEFSKIMNLKYGRITITSAKTRFGSCSSKGNICFSYRLMLYPETAREYVVVHELCHLVYMNHSSAFYGLLAKYLPDYKERRRRLK